MIRHKIDVVVTDIFMPIVDGAAMISLMKLYSADTKVIVSSVLPLEGQKKLIEGADAYHEKSLDMDSLVEMIRKVAPKQNAGKKV
jgi:DNA-binding NarL/FixJ family response regulator